MGIIEFTESYLRYNHPVLGWQSGTKLQQYEKDYLTNLVENKHTITAKSRQMHITTLLSAYAAHFLIFNTEDPRAIMYLALKLDQCYGFLAKVREIINSYYEANKEPVKWVRDGRKEAQLQNGNMIRVATGNYDSFCSMNLNEAIYDEAAFMTNFKEAYESGIIATKKMHVVSSLRTEYNFFNELWDGTSSFKKIRIHYSDNSKFYTPEKVEHLKSFHPSWDTEMELVMPTKKAEKKLSYTFRISEDLGVQLNNRVMDLDMGFSEYMRKLIMNDLNLILPEFITILKKNP